ncbi:MAG: hypothetical protein A2297_06100 [Elusimicrobia bacterium RIFOXYB2_FULL_48_7]|nr:MAG: hypothetical protein A2297_06100 [Elusimicrobia bacterium RIFOXYB2_FULL_48_7]
MQYERIFKALSDKTRLRILYVLLKAGKALCICEIMDALQLAHYNISRHMKDLKVTGLVNEKRVGKFIFYALDDSGNRFIKDIIKAVDSIPGNDFRDDMGRLKKRLSLREDNKCVIGILKNGISK